jgi:hypothetical protein
MNLDADQNTVSGPVRLSAPALQRPSTADHLVIVAKAQRQDSGGRARYQDRIAGSKLAIKHALGGARPPTRIKSWINSLVGVKNA